jgi:hypothetical protein
MAARITRTQVDLLGNHPKKGEFATWLLSTDPTPTATSCYRELDPLTPCDTDWMADKLIHHHYDETTISALKALYTNLNYKKFAKQLKKLPSAERVQKGNFGEVLLSDYIEACKGKTFAKVLKLRYNPNVDQAMKGDDVLMVNIIRDSQNKEQVELFLGETKFRKNPGRAVVGDLLNSLGKKKLPLSYPYLLSELGKNPVNNRLVKKLSRVLITEIKAQKRIGYFGLLLGGASCARMLQLHMNTTNDKLLLIALSDDDLEDHIEDSFRKAENKVKTKIKTL